MQTFLAHVTNAGKFITDGVQKFNEFKKKHQLDSVKDLKFQHLMESATVRDFVEKSGEKLDNIKDVTQNGFFSHMAAIMAGEGGLAALGGTALKAGGEIGVGNYAGAAAMLFQEGAKLFTSGEDLKVFRIGDWVFIDNGEEKFTHHERANAFWGEGAIFQDMITPEEESLTTEHILSIGFVKETGVGDGEIDVFQMDTGDIRRFRLQDVRHVPPGRADTLEDNKEMRMMKEIILDKEVTPGHVAGETPVDPGTEVEYDGDMYAVLYAEGSDVRIQNGDRSLTVDVGQLKRGRVEHNVAWNYGATEGGFNKDGKASLHKGLWVWVPPRSNIQQTFSHSTAELGVIRLLNGSTVDGYYAMNGERFQLLEGAVNPLFHEHQEFLDRHVHAKAFKQRAVEGGHSVRAYSLGKFMPLLCAGDHAWAPVKRLYGVVEEGHVVHGKTEGLLRTAAVFDHKLIETNTEGLEDLDDLGEIDDELGGGNSGVPTPGSAGLEIPTKNTQYVIGALTICVVGGALFLYLK